eukprot:gene4484-5686_t
MYSKDNPDYDANAVDTLLTLLMNEGWALLRMDKNYVTAVQDSYRTFSNLMSHTQPTQRKRLLRRFDGSRYVGFAEDKGREWLQIRSGCRKLPWPPIPQHQVAAARNGIGAEQGYAPKIYFPVPTEGESTTEMRLGSASLGSQVDSIHTSGITGDATQYSGGNAGMEPRREGNPSSETSAITPETSAVTPESSAVTPETSAVTPETSAVTPETSAVTPETSAITPETSAVTPETSAVTPETSA